MKKDIISWETKLLSLLGTFLCVFVPFMLFFQDAVKGNKLAITYLAIVVAIVDSLASLRLERLEKRIEDLEKLNRR